MKKPRKWNVLLAAVLIVMQIFSLAACKPSSEVNVTLNTTSKSLNVGETVCLTADVTGVKKGGDTTVVWTSSNSGVASVAGSDGLVAANAVGRAEITATSKADTSKKAVCTITVTAAEPDDGFIIRELLDNIAGKVFVYDEMEDGGSTGSKLYSLRFTGDNNYVLNSDGGEGVVARGKVSAGETGKKLLFKDGDNIVEADYDPAGNLIHANFENKDMVFNNTSDSTEYVYLAYVGAFYGAADGKEAILFLERFYEFFMYCDGQLTRGTYEVLQNGVIEFKAEVPDSAEFYGTVSRGSAGGHFDLITTKIVVDVRTKNGAVNAVEFGYSAAPATKQFEAAHGMSPYYLHLMKAGTFVIYGSDGLIKGLGSMEKGGTGGTAHYFERSFIENSAKEVEFTYDAESYTFPATTPLLPASGNIDPETGKGAYFTAGQILHFIQISDIDEVESDTTPYDFTGTVKVGGSPLANVKVYVRGEHKATTGSDGKFSVRDVIGGAHVHFEKENFQFSFYYVTGKTGELEVTGKTLAAPLQPNLPASAGLRQVMPSIGVARPLVIMVDFPDYPRTRFVTAGGVQDELFNISNYNSLSAYYYRSSYGQLRIEGRVMDWYRMPKPRAQYSTSEVMSEVVNYHIANGLNLDEFDANGDGIVDSLFVLWAGAPAGSGTWNGAFRSTWSGSPSSWSKKVTGFIFVPGSTVWTSVPPLKCNTVSLSHEVGHLLGINDYYSYDSEENFRLNSGYAYSGGAAEGGLGTMDIMDSNLGDHNAFSKWLLGWLEPAVIEFEDFATLDYNSDIFNLRSITENADALFIKLKSSSGLYTEMFVVEALNRSNNGRAWGRLSQPVVRILHVEATLSPAGTLGNSRGFGFMYDNSYTNIKFISVVEADGKDLILNFHSSFSNDKPNYEASNYFVEGNELTPFTYPNTNAYDNYGNATVFTGLKIKIGAVGADGAVVKLGYDGNENPGRLTLSSVTAGEQTDIRYETPLETNDWKNFNYINANTGKIEFNFNKNVSFAPGKSASDIIVYGNFSYITTGWTATIEGKKLVVTFANDLREQTGYRIILPYGLLCETGNPGNVNLNLISGFATKFVYRPVTGISFDWPTDTITVTRLNQKLYLGKRLVVEPADATFNTVTWTSSNPSVATVDSNGEVTVVGWGTAVITAASNDTEAGLSASFTIIADQNGTDFDTAVGFYQGVYGVQMGTWVDFVYRLELRGDNTFRLTMTSSMGSGTYSGSYTLSGGTLSLTYTGQSAGTKTYTYNSAAGGRSVTGAFPSGMGEFNLTLNKLPLWK